MRDDNNNIVILLTSHPDKQNGFPVSLKNGNKTEKHVHFGGGERVPHPLPGVGNCGTTAWQAPV